MFFDHLEEKEAVEKAALIEKNGMRFYSLLLDKVKDKKIRSALKKLIRDEKKHLKIIEKKYFPEAGFPEDVTEEEIEIERYVKRVGVPDLFARRINMEKLVALIDEPKKALFIALDAEMHSAQYFSDLSKKASTEDGRKIYRELAQEERSHVLHIEELLKAF